MSQSDYSVLRWGVAGCGRIAADFVSTLTLDSPTNHRFVAVASRSHYNAQMFTVTYNIPKAYGSYLELAQDSRVQIAYISNYNSDHFETAKLFLEHGKHVLVEKPLTLNAKQTEIITRLAKSKGLFLMEAIWSRFLPAYKFVMEQIQAGAIGRVVKVDAKFGKLNQAAPREKGGGTILGMGVYPINVVQMLFDNELPERITAVGSVNEDGVDTSINAALAYSNGRSASISTSIIMNLDNEARITGTEGTIRMLKHFHCCQRVLVNDMEYDLSYPDNAPGQTFPNTRGLRFEADEVRRLLMEGKIESETMPHRDSVTIAKIQDEIRKQVGVSYKADYNETS